MGTRAALILVATGVVAVVAAAAVGCGSSKNGGGGPTPTPTPGSACHATPAAADRTRFVVVSHPYSSIGNASGKFEVLRLGSSGVLSRTGNTFDLGQSNAGRIAFSPDGAIGVVAEGDGTLGVFRLAADGTPTVLRQSFSGTFYAQNVVFDPSGARVVVIDPDTVGNGGGLHSVDIACDGTPTDGQALLPASGAGGLAFLDATHALLYARGVAGVGANDDVELLEWSTSAAPVAASGASAFGDAEAIVPDVAVTADGRYGIVPDDDAFTGSGGRIAIVEISGATVAARQVLRSVEDPASVAASPFAGGGALVLSAEGNDADFLHEDSTNASAPFTIAGPVSWTGAPPQLPQVIATVDRGPLQGTALIAENLAVHVVRFPAGGGMPTDVGALVLGSNEQDIVGALGVQP